jgi:phosphoserine phosphatase RsbU/P
MFLGFLDTRTGVMSCLNAGHPPPYLIRTSGNVARIEGKPQAPLGVRKDTVYRSSTIRLEPDDALFVCTDGVAEAMNSSQELYGEPRLEADLRAARSAAPAAMIRAVKESIDRFGASASQADDVTMLAMRWQPEKK